MSQTDLKTSHGMSAVQACSWLTWAGRSSSGVAGTTVRTVGQGSAGRGSDISKCFFCDPWLKKQVGAAEKYSRRQEGSEE